MSKPLPRFRRVNHLMTFSPATGEYFPLPCRSATCARPECQRLAVARLAAAVRYAARGRRALFLTASKFSAVEGLDAFHDGLLKVLRAAGYEADALMVVEKHRTGLLHSHSNVFTTAPLAVVEAAAETALSRSPHVSSWSGVDVRLGARSSYMLKDAAAGGGSLLSHLALNSGRLYRHASRGFFVNASVRGLRACARAEARRSAAFYRLEELVGTDRARALSETLVSADAMRAAVAVARRHAAEALLAVAAVSAALLVPVVEGVSAALPLLRGVEVPRRGGD